MNLDEIEDLIRRYLSAGITVIIILVAPATGGTDDEAAPGREPSVVTIDPDRPELDDIPPDPRVRVVPDEDDGMADPDPADVLDRDPPQRADPSDADNPTDDPTDEAADEPADDREEDPAEDRDDGGEDGREDTTDVPSTAAEEPTDDTVRPSTGDEDDAADDDSTDADTTDRPDTGNGDPDLESRGPADGSEPGIDDERAAEPEDPPVSRDGDPAPENREATGAGPAATSEGTTAAERYGWGTPDEEDDFDSGLAQWDLYDGPGHAGEGLRSTDAVTVQDGVLTITGDAEGTTGGMTWNAGQRYGRWEGRVRAPASDPSYNALLLLWPDAEDFPDGGEIDFMEMLDPTRQRTDFFLHHGPDNDQVTAQVEIDGTEWHNWAVEWTPEEIVGYVDGEEWFRTSDTSTFPPGPMHLCIQLDWFPDGAGAVRESTMEVDWVRQYAVDPVDDEPSVSTGPASVPEPADDPLRRMFSWS